MGFLTSTLLVFVLGQGSHPAKAEMIVNSGNIAPGGSAWVGVKFTMDPGWHVYWKNPGDSGVAPYVDWSVSDGVKVEGPFFLTPERFVTEYETTFGFSDETVLLYRVSVGEKARGKVDLKGKVQWMVCKETCLMGSAELSRSFAVGQGSRNFGGEGGALLDRAIEEIPSDFDASKVVAFRNGEQIGVAVSTKGTTLAGGGEFDFFPSDEGVFDTKKPQIRMMGSALRLDLTPSEYLNGEVERVRGIVVGTKVDKNGEKVHFAVNIDVPIS